MFYMGGMTLGYFSPHAAKSREDDTADRAGQPAIEPTAAPRNTLSAVVKAAFAREIVRRQPHVWPIHVFY